MLSECIYTSGGGGKQVYCEKNTTRNYQNLFVDCGFVPRKIAIMVNVSNTSTATRWVYYDADTDPDNALVGVQGSSPTTYAIGTANSMIASISSSGGFTLYNLGNGYPYGSCSIIATD